MTTATKAPLQAPPFVDRPCVGCERPLTLQDLCESVAEYGCPLCHDCQLAVSVGELSLVATTCACGADLSALELRLTSPRCYTCAVQYARGTRPRQETPAEWTARVSALPPVYCMAGETAEEHLTRCRGVVL